MTPQLIYNQSIEESDIHNLCRDLEQYSAIEPKYYERFDVKRGLRNADGSGVIAGITRICNVHGYVMNEGERQPIPGQLIYRGYDINDLIENAEREDRYVFEEVVYLLLFGMLPDAKELEIMTRSLSARRELPPGFLVDSIMQSPSNNIMNKLARSILSLYSYSDITENTTIEDEMRIALDLIAKMPILMDGAYQAKRHKYDNASMIMHPLRPDENTAQSILSLIRNDRVYTKEEAQLLDVLLAIHADHGGGNNSTFTNVVISSTGTDIYSSISASIGSLKGPKHGGANIRCSEMISAIEKEIGLKASDAQIKQVIKRILDKDFYDHTGLVYGLGHAVYTVSDPRADLLKSCCEKLAKQKKREDEYEFLTRFEKVAKETLAGNGKTLSNNVDFYSGFAYNMLQIPEDMYTPLFVCARMAGWLAHNIENKMYDGKIMRPAFKYVGEATPYKKREER